MFTIAVITLFLIFLILFFSYLALLVCAARILHSRENFIPAATQPPVSVIVAMHNEEANVRQCLEHLLHQEYPAGLVQIIIVADRCTDATGPIVKTYAQSFPQIKLITINRHDPDFAPKKAAIDAAVQQAKGNFILLTDADGRPGPRWVAGMVSLFKEDVGMVLGYAPYISDHPFNTLPYRMLALEYFSHAVIAAVSARWKYPLTCVGTNLAYRKLVYEQLGGFGKYRSFLSGDDDLLLMRVRDETGWKIKYANLIETQVWNTPPVTFAQFYHQRLRFASKGFLYPAPVILALLGYFTLNLLVLALPLLIFLSAWLSLLLLPVVGLKIGVEYYFLKAASGYLKDYRHLKYIPLVSLVHVPYVVYFGIMSRLQKFHWRGKNS